MLTQAGGADGDSVKHRLSIRRRQAMPQRTRAIIARYSHHPPGWYSLGAKWKRAVGENSRWAEAVRSDGSGAWKDAIERHAERWRTMIPATEEKRPGAELSPPEPRHRREHFDADTA